MDQLGFDPYSQDPEAAIRGLFAAKRMQYTPEMRAGFMTPTGSHGLAPDEAVHRLWLQQIQQVHQPGLLG